MMCHFTFPPALYEWPSFSIYSIAFDIVTIFYLMHSYRYTVISLCGFNLYLPGVKWWDIKWCWISEYLLMCFLPSIYLLWWNVHSYFFPCSNWIFINVKFLTSVYLYFLFLLSLFPRDPPYWIWIIRKILIHF